MSEMILCTSIKNAAALMALGEKTEVEGIVSSKSVKDLFEPTYLTFNDRESIEKNELFKQIIPYVAVMNPEGEFYTFKRLKGAGETKLVGGTSIGFGGHINLIDGITTPCGGLHFEETLFVSVIREISEELGLKYSDFEYHPPEALGVLNDDSNPVGRVHIALLMLIRLKAEGVAKIKANEEAMILNPPQPLDRVEAVEGEKFENWTQMFVKYLKSIKNTLTN